MILPMDIDILSAYDDYILKSILTRPESKPVLMDLISSVIGRTVVNVELRNNELVVIDINEKNERLDVNCTIDSGDQVNVEIQASRMEERIAGEHRNFINRTIYYLTDLHSSQKSKGVDYFDIARTYQITFCMYTVFPNYHGYINPINMRRPDGELISDQINAVIIELSKLGEMLKKPAENMTPLDMWSVFLRYVDDPKQRKLINELIDRKEALGMAGEALLTISKDEHERAKFLSRKKFENDLYSNMRTAEIRGENRGREEGSNNRAFNIARNLLDMNMTIDDVVKSTGLSYDEVKDLKK